MKRRVEEATKVEGIPPVLHAQRSPHTVSSVVQPAYPNISKSAGAEVNSIQQYPIAASYVSMPSITASVKPAGNLQATGGASITAAASHTSGILVASGPFRHAKAQPSGGGTTPPTVVGSTGGGQSVSSAPAQQFQRLKVEDALSYLDQVKYKFQSQPQVYNDFLEIMKEFKSQCIDTPGVIARVSHLFKGYPELISGFNTFLPPGYKIEVQANDTGYSLQVSVSNPLGHQTMQEIPTLTPTQQHSVVVTNQTTKPPVTYTPTVGVVANVQTTHLVKGTPSLATVERRAEPSPQVQAAALAMSGVATQGIVQAERSPPRIATVTSIQGTVTSGTPLGIAMAGSSASVAGGHPAQPPALTAASVAVPPNSAAAATAVVLPPNHVPGPQQTSQPVEFNHAINYVNKIKNRFQGQPEKYKKFLEILHTYQKEQKNVKSANTGPVLVGGLVGSANSGKHLTEAEVYAQVAQLFEKHDDLLLEFGQFLPDATSHNTLSLASLVNTSNHHHSLKVTERKSTVNLKFGSGTVNRSESNVRDRAERNDRDNSGPREPVKTSPPTTGPKTLSGVKRSNEIFNNLPIGPNSPGSAAHPGPPGPVKRQKLTHPSTHSSFSHFEAIKRAFRNPGHYDQLLRCFYLFNLELISRSELICLIAPLLSRLPDHLNYFRDYLGETGPIGPVHPSSVVASGSSTAESGRSPVSPPAVAPAHHPSVQPAQHHPHHMSSTSSGHHNHHSHHGHHHHHSHHGNSQSNAASSSVSRDRDRDRDKEHIAPERERPLPLPLPLPPPLPPLGHGSLPPHLLDHHHPLSNSRLGLEPSRPDHATSAATADIDFSSCKRIGASYCALPKSAPPPRCSGRTLLCKQVLNDTWVSFPTWSEDSTFVTSRKTQYEEYIYRCEDERFELDLVIESNASTIVILENVQKKMSRMSPEELAKFTLDDNLGGTSSTIHVKAIRRIYGDKANDVIEGLKSNPSVAVPLVLRRLRYKENEWRHAQKGFNKTWRDQNEKFYLKSLDHQGINFKQSDLKGLRSKSLYNEIETAYDERHENDEGKTGPHIFLSYTDKNILDDAANLLIHHVKRQTGVHKQDKQRIKQLLRHSIPDMFHHRRQELSDDERDTDDKMDSDVSTNKENLGNAGNTPKGCNNNNNNKIKRETPNDVTVCANSKQPTANFKSAPSPNSSVPQEPPAVPVVKPEEHPSNHPDEVYTLFFGSNNWYLFIRLHQILCERLNKMSERSKKIADEEAQHSVNRKESTTAMLRLKPNEHWQDCYGSMLEMVKSVLDCSMESQTYEDTLRQMFGIHAYIGFTLDKIVIYAVRQLQYLVTDESCVECWDLHNTYRAKGGAGGPVATAEERAAMEANYMRAVTTCLSGENCYKICIYKKECKVTVELLDNESEEEEEGGGSDNGTADTKEKNGSASSNNANSSKKWSDVDSRTNSHSDRADSGTSSLNDKDRFTPIAPLYLRRLLKGKKDNSDESKNSKISSVKCFASGSLNDVIIIDKNDCLYKAGSIRRSRETHCKVTRRKFAKFSQWHQKWALREVSRTESEDATVWFMGRAPNTHPNVTKAVERDPGDERAPFRKYKVYTVSRT